jgi:Patatin-like phospholipase
MGNMVHRQAEIRAETFDGVSDPAGTLQVLMQEHQDLLQRRLLLLEEPDERPSPTLPESPFRAYYEAAHKLGNISALCLSGGGIRSAAFGLGVLQGLARLGLLHRFDYLSTVSGGGYIAGWLTSWVHRHPKGYAGVVDELLSGRELDSESPLAHLRRYSNFLTPHTGLLSSDTLTAIVLYIRNLLLNWLVIVPLVLAAIVFMKLVAIGTWTMNPELVGGLAVGAMTATGWSLLDSLRQRPGWESKRSNRIRFFWAELLPMAIGGLCASIALIKYYEYFIGEELPSWGAVAFHLGTGGAVLCLVAWLFAFYFMSIPALETASGHGNKPANPLPARKPSVTTTVAEAAARPGDWKHVAWAAVSYTIAGAVSGVLLSAAVALFAGLGFEISSFALTAEDTRVLLILCFGLPMVFLAIFLGEVVYVGLTSYAPWGDAEREWLARAAGEHAFAAGTWMVGSVLILFGSVAVFVLERHYEKTAIFILASSNITAGTIVAILGRASSTAAQLKKSAISWLNLTLNGVLAIGTVVFVACAVALLSAGFDYFALNGAPLGARSESTYLAPVLKLCGAMIIVGFLFSLFVNVNRFSLHGVYRDRIVRTFLGASRRKRSPNPFTGFDQHDNLHLETLWPSHASADPDDPTKNVKPERLPPQLMVINMAQDWC